MAGRRSSGLRAAGVVAFPVLLALAGPDHTPTFDLDEAAPAGRVDLVENLIRG